MRSYWTLNRTKAIVGSLAGAAILTGPIIADKSAFAENTDEVAAMGQPRYLIQPSVTHPGYILPPLSDHLIVAQLNDDQFALEEEEKDANAAFGQDDGTAKQYNRGYYAEPVQIIELVSDDGTARQYDRGYYKDPEMIVALIIVPSEDIE